MTKTPVSQLVEDQNGYIERVNHNTCDEAFRHPHAEVQETGRSTRPVIPTEVEGPAFPVKKKLTISIAIPLWNLIGHGNTFLPPEGRSLS
jgi:hypothetical protein